MLFVQRGDQRLRVDEGPARDVDQHCTGLHRAERRSIDHMVGFGRRGGSDNDSVTAREHFVQLRGAEYFVCPRRRLGVDGGGGSF